jgi:hypothetical protein
MMMMQGRKHCLLLAIWIAGVFAILHGSAFGQQPVALRAGFHEPPASAKARCYWWWLNGNTTPDTITRDLEGMKAKGLGGAILVDADGSGQDGNDEVPVGPAIGSPQWIALFVHALDVAQRLGLEISLNVTSRWDVGVIGGPAVTPADAIKLLTWSRTTVEGGGAKNRTDSITPSRCWLTHCAMALHLQARLAVIEQRFSICNSNPLPRRPVSP